MTDPTPTPEAKVPVRRSWRRARIYLWSLLIVLGIWMCGTFYLLRQEPRRVVARAFRQLPFPSQIGKVYWQDQRTLKIEDVKIGDFFSADSIVISGSLYHLFHHRIDTLIITGPQVFTSLLYRAMEKTGASSPSAGGLDWSIDSLTISRGTLEIDNGRDVPSIPIRIGVLRPLLINHLHLNAPDKSVAMTEERIVDLENINLVSPFDPLAPVLAFPLTRVRFTYTELWHHHIREIDLIRPTMYLGQDLFWFTDQVKADRQVKPAAGPDAPWQVGHFEVSYGQLAINAFGQPAARLPFFFETKVDDIRLDQLDKISAKSVIAIRQLSQEYPDYKVRIVNLSGKLEFSLPPSDATANNVVPTIHVDSLSWNEIAATDVWASVTFDPTGIYGKLGGNCEKGYLKGNFEVYYTKGFTWNGNIFADQIDCAPVAEKIAGHYFALSGVLNGKIEVQGRTTEILKCDGLLQLPNPGNLEIHSLDDLLQRLPANTIALKREALKIAIEAFKSYPYTTGQLKLNYTPDSGEGILALDSPHGKREFSVYWHPYDGSKVAKEADTR